MVAVARSADAVIALPGSYGTLSEIGHALALGKPVIGINTWDVRGVQLAHSSQEAVMLALKSVEKSSGSARRKNSP